MRSPGVGVFKLPETVSSPDVTALAQATSMPVMVAVHKGLLASPSRMSLNRKWPMSSCRNTVEPFGRPGISRLSFQSLLSRATQLTISRNTRAVATLVLQSATLPSTVTRVFTEQLSEHTFFRNKTYFINGTRRVKETECRIGSS